ncbi:DUF3500 domain-containing protein [Duganella guangzhouensis]|uniref:DUF3500 domain-containing protein n=1 Tax=Duganella guangzhouensis TaxID=2666084 RepID=UPI0018A2308B|nr:DUF3500 domain-containing protein [Duganella guangzhouensis]
MFNRFFAILTLLFAALLAACGGGSSDSSSSSTSTTTTSATAPSITTQPTSVSVTAGSTASFSVVATGTATLTYQWRKDGTAINDATSAAYSISSTATSDAGSYDVVVSNSAGSVTSSAATLTVSSADGLPVISTQPTSISAAVGGDATFTVVATGNSLTYQWRKSGVAISGATGTSYTISPVAATDAGSFDVVVTNSAGSVTSSTVTLTVSSTTTADSALSASVYTAAMTFYNTLSTTQQSTIVKTWDLATARKWSNLPAAMVARNGVSWGALSTAQQTAATSMISTALSSTGVTLWQGLQAADDYLNANGGGSSYGNGNYYIAFVGSPSTTGFWMLQLTGHHLTYNIALNGTYKSPTPLFLGVEPKGSFTQSSVTYDPMLAQRTAFSNLGAALLSYSGAKLSGTYADILFGANGSGSIDGTCPRSYSTVTDHGLLYTSLSTTDQALVQTAIKAYVATQATEYNDDLLSAYLSSTALASTYVAYTGTGTVTANGNYFRIEGPRLWIEFSVQKGVIFSSDIHYHTIWRDKYGDYGGKCL